MKRNIFCLFFLMIFFSAGFVFAQDYPVQYKEDCGLEPWEFFEKEYRVLWNTLSEEEQFAIVCSANTFERNEQYHLDFSNKTLFNKDTTTGKYILNERWEVYSKEELLEADKDLEENGQAVVYRKLEALLEKYPDSSIIEIGEKEELTVNQVSRLYMIQQMHVNLGVHGIDAWDDSRRITILRWGMGAGYLSEAECLEIIKPIVSRIKNNYRCFEEYFAHWMAGYCYDAVFSSTCPECILDVLDALASCRAYVPYEQLKFTGINADPEHEMTFEEGVYYPSKSELAEKLIPVQQAYKRYWNETPSEEILNELIEAENNYPEASNLTMMAHVELLYKFGTAADRIEYIESKQDFLNSLGEDSKWYNDIIRGYFRDLVNTYQADKFISLYKKLPVKIQANNDIYFDYGYANILKSNLCITIVERDLYIMQAMEVFKQLDARDYEINDFIRCWINAVESL